MFFPILTCIVYLSSNYMPVLRFKVKDFNNLQVCQNNNNNETQSKERNSELKIHRHTLFYKR